jgi:hypothetical protein
VGDLALRLDAVFAAVLAGPERIGGPGGEARGLAGAEGIGSDERRTGERLSWARARGSVGGGAVGATPAAIGGSEPVW